MFEQLDTPALILDRQRLIRNCNRAHNRCRTLGTKLRPHLKTAKAIEVARLAIDPLFGGIAVSTLAEAGYFADAGFSDIQYAVCIEPFKIAPAFELAQRVRRFSVFVDSLDAVEALAAVGGAASSPLGVWIEADCGDHRTGLPADGALLIEIARRIDAANCLHLEGVATHAGQAYAAASIAEVAATAALERSTILCARDALKANGFVTVHTSVGSTPTLMHAVSGDGIDEFRAGVYMFGDLYQAGIGSLSRDDIALTVLTTVLSRNEAAGRFFVDAGALALSKDRSTALLAANDAGYGELLTVAGQAYHGLIVSNVSQEHGFVAVAPDMPVPAIGTRFRVQPNHACLTAAMYDTYHVLDSSTLETRWSRINGWGR
jgi:D-serine deaminase-like pyridoxal phosphate-dependent protein